MDEHKGLIDTEVNGRVVPLIIQAEQVIPPVQLARNVAVNLARDIPRFTCTSGQAILRRDEKIAIVSGGHSLDDQIDELRTFDTILVCGSAHDHLVRQGIIPTYATVCDGGAEDKGNLSLPQKGTKYIIASQCNPNLFEHLSGYDVEMFHYRGQIGRTIEEDAKAYNNEPSIGWGSSVSLVSVHIAALLGFQYHHMFAFDHCYSKYAVAQHAYDVVGGHEFDKVPVVVGPDKKLFISNMGLMNQIEQFFTLAGMWYEWIHFTLHGDGLIHEMVRHGDPELSKYVSIE